MKVFVTGASGFLGRNLVPLLLKKNIAVSEWKGRAQGDLTDPAIDSKLKAAMQGCDAVIHMAAKTSQDPSGQAEAAAVNVEATRKLVNLAKELGIKRFVFVSSQSAKITNPGNYGASKKKAEDIVLSSGLDAVILRPAIIYGPGKAGIFKKFVGLVSKIPVLPLPWTTVTFQPVFVGDVVASIASAVEISKAPRQAYDIVGPDAVTFPQLIQSVAKIKGLSRMLIPIPMPMALLGARLLALVLKKPPVTVDNLIGLSEKTLVDIQPMIDELKITPVSLAEGLKVSLQ